MFVDDDHPSFRDKPEASASVWRYMDLARYLSLLQSSCLHFVRPDTMDDAWEGSFGHLNAELRPSLYGENYASMQHHFPQMRRQARMFNHINCWHLAEGESAAMWAIYQREGRGVAVRTTWSNLTASIKAKRDVFGARLKYVDYSATYIPEGNLFDALMHKRSSFQHEQEVRLIFMSGNSAPDPERPETDSIQTGPEDPVIPIEVDLSTLVGEVYVAPDSPLWIQGVVADVTKRYGYDFPVHRSDMASDPLD